LDYFNVWDEIEIPVLQMHGADDGSIPIEAGRDISSRIADSRFVAIDDSDHFIHIDAPDQWIEEVTRFVEALPE
jgi:pimeloyl-ACP methyl ester carboxylesterase